MNGHEVWRLPNQDEEWKKTQRDGFFSVSRVYEYDPKILDAQGREYVTLLISEDLEGGHQHRTVAMIELSLEEFARSLLMGGYTPCRIVEQGIVKKEATEP